MKREEEAQLLRIFVGETDKWHNKPVYEQIVMEARKAKMAGATAFKGVMSFGSNSRKIHSAKVLRLSEDLPMIVEIVDKPEKIEEFLPIVHTIFEDADCGGLVTVERAHVIRYEASGKNGD